MVEYYLFFITLSYLKYLILKSVNITDITEGNNE